MPKCNYSRDETYLSGGCAGEVDSLICDKEGIKVRVTDCEMCDDNYKNWRSLAIYGGCWIKVKSPDLIIYDYQDERVVFGPINIREGYKKLCEMDAAEKERWKNELLEI